MSKKTSNQVKRILFKMFLVIPGIILIGLAACVAAPFVLAYKKFRTKKAKMP